MAGLVRRLVHLDLKGAPPKISYFEQTLHLILKRSLKLYLLPLLEVLQLIGIQLSISMTQLFPCLKMWGATGLLIEYEDMFPYKDSLQVLASPNVYSCDDIKQIQAMAKVNELVVIPLIQTFGHLEFVLKHEQFWHLSECSKSLTSICPSRRESLWLLKEIIKQVLELHSDAEWIHIGADEVWNLGECESCRTDSKENVYLRHIASVAQYIHTEYPGKIPILWDDMLRCMDPTVLTNCEIKNLVEPMVWHYLAQDFCITSDVFAKLSLISDHLWIASAFKGATGPEQDLPNIEYHIQNQERWIETLKCSAVNTARSIQQFRGCALTGWQRYDHFAVLCELLPTGIPSLVMCLQTLKSGGFNAIVFRSASELLGINRTEPIDIGELFRNGDICKKYDFPGKEVYAGILVACTLRKTYLEFKNSTIFKGWYSDYHVKHRFSSMSRIEFLLSSASSLLLEFSELRCQLEFHLHKLFFPTAVEEWFSEKLDFIIRDLTQIEANLINIKMHIEKK